jgi:hypothetical protein
MNAGRLGALINELGIPTTAGRSAAIRQHVLEMQPPWSRTPWATTPSPPPNSAAQAGDTWSRYAPAITHDHPELATVERELTRLTGLARTRSRPDRAGPVNATYGE